MNGRSIFCESRRFVTDILKRLEARHGRDLKPARMSLMLTATLFIVPHHPSDCVENSLSTLLRLIVFVPLNAGADSPCGQWPAISVATVLQKMNASG